MQNNMRTIQTMEVQLMIGMIGKKDVKREYYQVKEVKRKCRVNCATQGEA